MVCKKLKYRKLCRILAIVPFVVAAVLSVFGVGYERVCRAARGVSALSVERFDGGVKVCVSREDYGAALKALHRDLIE